MIWDLETNGCKILPLTHKFHKIIQITAITLSGKVVINTLVNPGINIPKMSTCCHGITNDDVKDAPDIDTVLDILCEKMEGMTHMIAHNGKSFDIPVMTKECIGHKFHDIFTKIGHIDSLVCFRFMYPELFKRSRHGIRAYSLGNLHEFFIGGQIENAHDAFNDVRALRNLIKFIKDAPVDIDSPKPWFKTGTPTCLTDIRSIGMTRARKIRNITGCNSPHELKEIENLEEILRTRVGIMRDQEIINILSAAYDRQVSLDELHGDGTSPHKSPTEKQVALSYIYDDDEERFLADFISKNIPRTENISPINI